ncbi:nucleolar protein 16 [Chiloscyllium plagiosum]|uniref:nucleolar protein 16 n=1 Tax=Chiloscyllium plagiosum TaxID=36176 RepID=UPI001CB858B1|nr:nucleolar protein 16 [Chiloscyllium plagiosum]
MPNAKGKNRRKKFNYNINRKRLKRRMQKKENPRIECALIRKAWDNKRSVAQNMADMGIASDPNRAIPIKKNKQHKMETASINAKPVVIKPYVINELEAEANIPEVKNNTLSRELIDYARYMIENYKDNYKAMARDEINYYQDTPKQIRRKIECYKRWYPDEYSALVDSLQLKMDTS